MIETLGFLAITDLYLPGILIVLFLFMAFVVSRERAFKMMGGLIAMAIVTSVGSGLYVWVRWKVTFWYIISQGVGQYEAEVRPTEAWISIMLAMITVFAVPLSALCAWLFYKFRPRGHWKSE